MLMNLQKTMGLLGKETWTIRRDVKTLKYRNGRYRMKNKTSQIMNKHYCIRGNL